VSDAGTGVAGGGDRLEQRSQAFPCLGVSAGHEGRSGERPLRAARDAHADEAPGSSGRALDPAIRVAEETVAAVHHDVVLLEQRVERIEHRVHRVTRGHHHEKAARSLERAHQRREILRHCELCFGMVGGQLARHLRIAVEAGDPVAAAREVAGEIGAHDAESHDANIVASLVHLASPTTRSVTTASPASP
jgi:hypothetical protein